MKTVTCTIFGIRPLLQNKLTPEDLFNKSRKKLTYEETVDATIVKKKLHLNEEGKVVQPAESIQKTLENAAVFFPYKGKKSYKPLIQGGITILPALIEHIHQNWKVDESVVTDDTAKFVARPRLDEWELSFSINIGQPDIEPSTLKEIMEYAGKFVGLGSRRKAGYGKFEIKEWRTN